MGLLLLMRKARRPHFGGSVVSMRSGFTLVETMIALFLFSMMALGLTAALIMSLKTSDRVVCRSTAHSIALGYAEQIMANSYKYLKESLSLGSAFTLYSTSLGATEASQESFTFGVEHEQLIVLDIDRETGEATRSMPMRFTIDATSLNSGADPVSALEISINYSYMMTAGNASDESSWKDGSVHIVKSLVDIY